MDYCPTRQRRRHRLADIAPRVPAMVLWHSSDIHLGHFYRLCSQNFSGTDIRCQTHCRDPIHSASQAVVHCQAASSDGQRDRRGNARTLKSPTQRTPGDPRWFSQCSPALQPRAAGLAASGRPPGFYGSRVASGISALPSGRSAGPFRGGLSVFGHGSSIVMDTPQSVSQSSSSGLQPQDPQEPSAEENSQDHAAAAEVSP